MTTIKERTEIARESKRDIPATLNEIEQLATMSSEVALSCFYVIFDKKDNKPIVGISVRFAELVASCWSNIQAGAKIIRNNGMTVVVQGFVHDFEKNALFTVEVERYVGKLSIEQQTQASNAASSIAFRNAVFKAIPAVLFSVITNKIKKYITDNISASGVCQETIAYFLSKSVTKSEIMNRLNVMSLDTLSPEHTFLLIGLKNAIEEGDTTLAEAFSRTQQADNKPMRNSKFNFGEDVVDVPTPNNNIKSDVIKEDLIDDSHVQALKSIVQEEVIHDTPTEKPTKESLKIGISNLSQNTDSRSKVKNIEVLDKKEPNQKKKRGRGRPRKDEVK